MKPIAIPSAIEYANGINTIVKKAGTASVISSQSMCVIPWIMSTPMNNKAGAVAKPGTD